LPFYTKFDDLSYNQKTSDMKKIILLFGFLFISIFSFAQDEETRDMIPLNWFIRVSPSIFAINSTPSTINFDFIDDDYVQPDSAFATLDTKNMWSYGFSAEMSYMTKKDFTITHNAFIGLGANTTWTYMSQISLGKEFIFSKFFVQPRIGLAYIYNNLKLGEFYTENKSYFEINGRFIQDNMKVRMKSRAFAISPSILVEYPLSSYIGVFVKVSGFYSFGRRSYLTFTGTTDEYDSDGNSITAFENRNFEGNGVYLAINNQQLFSRKTPYLPYNFNSLFVEIGFGVQLMEFY
jgi:hypothetical protein